MMKEAKQFFSNREPEETLVTPRFDEVETVQAQPVVPLAEVPPDASARAATGARRPSWPLALILISALVGSVVGGAGLYVYQRRATNDTPSNAEPAPTPALAEAPQPSTEAGASEETASLPSESTDSAEDKDAAQIEAAEIVEPRKISAPAHEETEAVEKKAADKAPAPDPRRVVEREDNSGGAIKRGKKAERETSAPPEPRYDDNEGEARLSDTIIYPRNRRAERREERREERRQRRANRPRSVDRVRGIFEGQPE
jgi:hypothetical protein